MDARSDGHEVWRERCWAADTALRQVIGAGAPHRAHARFGSVRVTDMGVPHPWGVQASAGRTLPAPADVGAALDWCRARAGAGWCVSVPEGLRGQGAWPWPQLRDGELLPMFAADAAAVRGFTSAVPAGLVLDTAPSFDGVVTGYGGWMDDAPLARLLVVPDDLHRPERRFVVGSVAGRVVGCALVWFAAGTGYLSGIGVLPDLRGRGYGRALTAAAARIAAEGPAGGAGPDLVWMHATDEGAALYARMGFVRIDAELQLGPVA